MAFLLFVDLSAAFDKLNRDFLWKTIKLRFKPGTNTKIINLLEHLYSTTSAEIKGNESLVFNIETGVFQGGPESPILYNLFMDYVMRVFMLKCREENVKFISHSYSIPEYASSTGTEVNGETDISWSGYADDIGMHLASIKDLQTASRILDQVFGQYQLIINYKKTETMILNYSNIKDAHKPQDEARIEQCKAADTEKPNLQKHGEAVHEKSDEACGSVANTNLTTDRHQCEMCEKNYQYKRGLVRHIKDAHKGQCEPQIEQCSAAETERPSLQRHGKAVHKSMNVTNMTGANQTTNKHPCNRCEKVYQHKGSLNRHIKNVHEKDTKVKDKLQNSISMGTPSLKEHPKVDHTSKGDFCCEPCKKTYKYKGYLERHIKLVHEREQGTNCDRCNLTFKEMSKFRQHITTKHKEPKTKLEEYPSSILNIKEHRIDNKKTFKYLGTKLTNDQPSAGNTEIKHRKIQASIAFNENRRLLKNYRINLQTRIHFLHSLVRSRLTYNCQTWPLTKAQTDTLNASYVRHLRELLRNGTYRKPNSSSMMLTDKEAHEITKTKQLGCFIPDLQHKFIPMITRAPNSNQNKMLLFNRDRNVKRGRKAPSLFEQVLKTRNQSLEEFCRDAIADKV